MTPSGVAGLDFGDEIEIGNRYAARAAGAGRRGDRRAAARGRRAGAPGGGDQRLHRACSGPIVPIAEGLSDAVDVVVSGHTHQAYNCVSTARSSPAPAPSAAWSPTSTCGSTRSPATWSTRAARNVVVGRDVPARPRRRPSSSPATARCSAPIAARRVGETTAPITRASEPLVGDPARRVGAGRPHRRRPARRHRDEQGAVAAFMNPGGVRADLDAGPVLYEEAFAVQPFNNYLITLDLTGAQLDCLLEQQFVTGRDPAALGRGDLHRRPGRRARHREPTRAPGPGWTTLAIDGVPVDPAATYRITVNNFLAGGGDGFTVLTEGTGEVVGGLDIDAFADYLTASARSRPRRPTGSPWGEPSAGRPGPQGGVGDDNADPSRRTWARRSPSAGWVAPTRWPPLSPSWLPRTAATCSAPTCTSTAARTRSTRPARTAAPVAGFPVGSGHGGCTAGAR